MAAGRVESVDSYQQFLKLKNLYDGCSNKGQDRKFGKILESREDVSEDIRSFLKGRIEVSELDDSNSNAMLLFFSYIAFKSPETCRTDEVAEQIRNLRDPSIMAESKYYISKSYIVSGRYLVAANYALRKMENPTYQGRVISELESIGSMGAEDRRPASLMAALELINREKSKFELIKAQISRFSEEVEKEGVKAVGKSKSLVDALSRVVYLKMRDQLSELLLQAILLPETDITKIQVGLCILTIKNISCTRLRAKSYVYLMNRLVDCKQYEPIDVVVDRALSESLSDEILMQFIRSCKNLYGIPVELMYKILHSIRQRLIHAKASEIVESRSLLGSPLTTSSEGSEVSSRSLDKKLSIYKGL